MLTAKAKQCPPFADERCTGFGGGATVGAGYWRTDVRGALVWASWQFMQRDVKVTHYMWNFIDLVEGHQLQLTGNRDKSRTFVAIYMHDNRLYITEGTVPDGDPSRACSSSRSGSSTRTATACAIGTTTTTITRRRARGGATEVAMRRIRYITRDTNALQSAFLAHSPSALVSPANTGSSITARHIRLRLCRVVIVAVCCA